MTKKKHQDQHRSQDERTTDQEQAHQDENEHEHDLIEYDPEKAEELVDVEEAAEHANQVHEPHRDEAQHQKKGVPPGQENVPSGFTTGRGMQGGSANRRKR